MQFVTSAPNFWETAFPSPRSVGPNRKCATVLSLIYKYTLIILASCFKGDEASQWKRPKFDPSPHQNPL